MRADDFCEAMDLKCSLSVPSNSPPPPSLSFVDGKGGLDASDNLSSSQTSVVSDLSEDVDTFMMDVDKPHEKEERKEEIKWETQTPNVFHKGKIHGMIRNRTDDINREVQNDIWQSMDVAKRMASIQLSFVFVFFLISLRISAIFNYIKMKT